MCADTQTDVYFSSRFPAKLPNGLGDEADESQTCRSAGTSAGVLSYCKWQRPPSPSPLTSLVPPSFTRCLALSVGSERERFPKRRPLAGPQAAGTLTSPNDLQPGLSLCSSSAHSHHNLCRTGLRVHRQPDSTHSHRRCSAPSPVQLLSVQDQHATTPLDARFSTRMRADKCDMDEGKCLV